MSNWKQDTSDLSFSVSKKWKVGIVCSRFNDDVTSRLQEGALQTLSSHGLKDLQISSIEVPGAYEVPLAAKWLIEKKFDGVIALGCVIRGETPHFEYVCNSVERACTQLQLQSGCPVVFGILTTDDKKQAMDRVGGQHGHKGEEAALTMLEMLTLRSKILDMMKN